MLDPQALHLQALGEISAACQVGSNAFEVGLDALIVGSNASGRRVGCEAPLRVEISPLGITDTARTKLGRVKCDVLDREINVRQHAFIRRFNAPQTRAVGSPKWNVSAVAVG